MTDLSGITNALIAGDEGTVTNLIQKSLNDGVDPKEILNEGLIKGMDIVGEKMEDGDMFIPEVLMSAKAMSSSVEMLKPLLGADDVSVSGRVVIGTVKGDLHDIGKNLVKMMLESLGFDVIDLGVDVTPEAFAKTATEKDANIVAFSALLTTTMPVMKETIDLIVESGFRDRVKIMVGGAPVSQKFADEIGADGYASDAGSASRLAKNLVKSMS